MFMFDEVHRVPNECNGEIRTVNILFIKLRCVAWVRLPPPGPCHISDVDDLVSRCYALRACPSYTPCAPAARGLYAADWIGGGS